MTYESSSAASDVSLAPFGLRIIRAMQPSAARGETAECVALRWSGMAGARDRVVAEALVSCGTVQEEKRSLASRALPRIGRL
jgi:hypothetical protein